MISTTQLPQLPQVLPTTQAAWQQLLNTFQTWTQLLASGTPWAAPTLLNGWVNYNVAYNPAGYAARLPDRIYCRGLISGGTVTDGTVLCTLPYAPAYKVLTIAQAYNGTSYAPVRLDVDTSGDVLILDAPGFSGAYWVSLDGLSFSTLP